METFDALNKYTLAVKERVAANKAYAIGLRLSQRAAQELSEHSTLVEFQRWLDKNDCYIFTINGFPYGQFHGTRVKENVYLPDWTSSESVAYTNLLFDLLAQLLPKDVEGSVSTVPCGFKELIASEDQWQMIRRNLWECVEHIARVSERSGRKLHLGLEPEPLCLLETSAEVVRFFDEMRDEHRGDSRLAEHLGVNYDTCHLAVEFEEPQEALGSLIKHGIRISKLHLSSALKVKPTPEARAALRKFADDIYLHQVIVRYSDSSQGVYRYRRQVYRDLSDALAEDASEADRLTEWRIHFHVPLHSSPTPIFDNTTDHLLGVLDILRSNPGMCSHLEMETYTWDVLPAELRSRDVVEQLVAEYDWTLARLAERGLKADI